MGILEVFVGTLDFDCMLEEVLYIVLVEVQKELQGVHHLVAVVGKVVQVDQCHLLVVDLEAGVEVEAVSIILIKYQSLV